MNIECEESFTPRDVYLSILQAHGGFINQVSLLRRSETCERNFERTYVNSYQQNYESNVSSDKTNGNISRKTVQLTMDHCRTTNNNDTIAVTKEQKENLI